MSHSLLTVSLAIGGCRLRGRLVNVVNTAVDKVDMVLVLSMSDDV